MTKIQEKLYQNRYMVDEGRPHIRLTTDGRNPSPALRSLVRICPAGCYEETPEGRIELSVDGCLECGTCRIVTQATGEIEWTWPRGGYGVLFKFG